MARSTEGLQDGRLSVWNVEPEAQAPAPGWLQPLKAWQRWAARRRHPPSQRNQPPQHDPQRSEATTLPEPGRGQALRQAHRALRERMRAQRGLRQVLPHLYFIERSLSRQGSVALLEMPVWVLQRGLQQLSRLPADSLTERTQFSVLQLRLVEAIAERSSRAGPPPAQADAPDSFMGGLDSQLGTRGAPHTAAGGLDVREVPRAVYDDLVQGTLPRHDDAANLSGWSRG